MATLLFDLGYEMKSVLAVDAKATEHILHIQGFGRLTHMDVAHLWMQYDVTSRRLGGRRIKGEEHVADLGTKPLSEAVISKHSITLTYANMAEERFEGGQQDVDFGSGPDV